MSTTTTFDTSRVECVKDEFIRIADEIQDNWEEGDLAASCAAMSEFGGLLKDAAKTGNIDCQVMKHQLVDAIDAMEMAWPTNRLAGAVAHVVGIAEAMKST